MSRLRTSAGFTLIETLIATAVAVTAVFALAHLVAAAGGQAARNRRQLPAVVAAQAKLEELCAIEWLAGADPPALAESPPGTLLENVAGYVDDVGGSVRRWAISRFEPADPDTILVRVCVFRDTVTRQPEACVSTLHTRTR